MSKDNSSTAPRPPPTPRRQPQSGDVLDGTYRIDSVLGFGGVGVVCAAWHLHVQRPCAVKFLHPQLVTNPELRARFRREAQSAFQLGHPHIVSITDFRDDPTGWPYIVMELVEGETLRARLERGPLNPRLSVRLMGELCDALHTAHRRSVIHRDLKPENLFLTFEEGDEKRDEDHVFLKVLDFGLSKILDESDITETGRLLGSPSYMSPEQARGESHLVDARSDIFAVGGLLYECLTGYKLFEADSFEQKRQRIMAGQLPPLRLAQRGMPAELETIIRTACAQRAEDRYQSAAAMAEALSRVYPDEAVVQVRRELSGRNAAPLPAPVPQQAAAPPPPPSPAPPAPLPAPPSPPAAAVPASSLAETSVLPAVAPAEMPAASGTSAGLGGPQNSGWQTGELVPTGQRALPRKRRTGMWISVIAGGLALGGMAALFAFHVISPSRPFGGAEPLTVPLSSGEEAQPKGRDRDPGKQAAFRPSPANQQRQAGAQGHEDHGHPGKAAHVAKVDKLTISDVDPVMRHARPAIIHCFPADVAIPARVTVDAVVAQTGKVTEATAEVGEDQAGCVVDTLRALHFPSFAGTDQVSVHYEFLNLRHER